MDNLNLVKALAGCDFNETLDGPKGDTFHHLQSVDILKGDDDYKTTGILHVHDKGLDISSEEISTPNRLRGMSGVVLTFWSEEHYVWSKQILFHKGQVYESETIIEENVDIEDYKPDNQLAFNLEH